MVKTGDIKEIIPLLGLKKKFIFDFDGTIADTEALHWAAYNKCLSEFGIILTDEDIRRYIGHTETEIYGMIKKDFEISFDEEAFFNKRTSIFLGLVRSSNLRPYKFFTELLDGYGHVRISILSSQRVRIISHMLGIWGLEKVFEKIISVADADVSKETVFKNIYGHFGVHCSEAVLFEDSNRNLALAKNQGILSIGIEHRYNRNKLKDCDAVITP